MLDDNLPQGTSDDDTGEPEITKGPTLHEALKALAIVQDYAVKIRDVDFLETVSESAAEWKHMQYHQCVRSTPDHLILEKD